MVENIDHIGIAVHSLDASLKIWRDILGMEFAGTETVESQKVTVAFLNVGQSRIELLEPTSDDSPIAKFLAKNGEGVHHMAIRVDDIEAALMKARSEGARLIHESPVPGAHGAQIAFLHPASTGKVLVELCQPGEQVHHEMMVD